jgi:hypothetical protein
VAVASFIYGELKSRDLFDQVSEYIYRILTGMRGYVSVKCGTRYVTIPMDSAGAVYYFLDRLWVFEGYITVTQDVCELYNFFFIALDDYKRPITGVTIVLDKPVVIYSGRYTFRLEYTFTVDDWFASDVMCLDKRNYEYGDYMCAI